MRTRQRMRVFTLLRSEFEASGISKTELAIRLGKGKDQIGRWLNFPGNIELDTLSDLLFAISGAEASYSIARPQKLKPNKEAVPKNNHLEAKVGPSEPNHGNTVVSLDLYRKSQTDEASSTIGSVVFLTSDTGKYLNYG
jgi:hypothetical protein